MFLKTAVFRAFQRNEEYPKADLLGAEKKSTMGRVPTFDVPGINYLLLYHKIK